MPKLIAFFRLMLDNRGLNERKAHTEKNLKAFLKKHNDSDIAKDIVDFLSRMYVDRSGKKGLFGENRTRRDSIKELMQTRWIQGRPQISQASHASKIGNQTVSTSRSVPNQAQSQGRSGRPPTALNSLSAVNSRQRV